MERKSHLSDQGYLRSIIMQLPRSLSYFVLVLFISIFGGSASFANTYVFSAPMCSSVLSEASVESWTERRVQMDKTYLGENSGQYSDPVTRAVWKVKYFTAEELRQYKLTPQGKVLVDFMGKKAESAFDADSLHFDSSLIVINKNREILVLPFEERGRFHHSSLTAGQEVIFAGTATFANGKLRSLSDMSGHYKPDALQFLVALRTLFKMGVDMTQLRVEGHLAQDVFGTASMTQAEVKAKLGILFQDRDISLSEVQGLLK